MTIPITYYHYHYYYLKAGLGNACAGQVRDTVCSRLADTKPIIAVGNFGKVVPIGSARFIALVNITGPICWPGYPENGEEMKPTNQPVQEGRMRH